MPNDQENYTKEYEVSVSSTTVAYKHNKAGGRAAGKRMRYTCNNSEFGSLRGNITGNLSNVLVVQLEVKAIEGLNIIPISRQGLHPIFDFLIVLFWHISTHEIISKFSICCLYSTAILKSHLVWWSR